MKQRMVCLWERSVQYKSEVELWALCGADSNKLMKLRLNLKCTETWYPGTKKVNYRM